MIQKRVKRTGKNKREIWGWGDKDQLQEEYEDATILHKKINNC